MALKRKREYIDVSPEEAEYLAQVSAARAASGFTHTVPSSTYGNPSRVTNQPLGCLQWFNVAITATPTSAAAGYVEDSLCHIPAGTGESARAKRQIKIFSLQIKGYVSQDPAAVYADRIRIILVQDKAPDGSTILITDVLDSDNINSLRDIDDKARFRVLSDRTIDLPVYNDSATGDVNITYVTYDYYRWFKTPIVVDYNSTTGAINEIRTNNLVLFALCHRNTNFARGVFTSRVRYTSS